MVLRWLALGVLAGCTTTRAPMPEPPTGLTTVAVAPVVNATGDELVVSGDNFVAKMLKRPKRTVADALRDELKSALRRQGFSVADAGAVPTLRVTLRHFEPDLPQLTWISVAVEATLGTADAPPQWTAERSRWLVDVRGAPTLAAAYESAAQNVARALVDGWQPAK